MNCPNCGSAIKPGVQQCDRCGSAIQAQPYQAPPQQPHQQPQTVQQQQQYVQQVAVPVVVANVTQKSRVAAGVLGILFGGLGVHRFYLGYAGIGILQIIVSFITAGFGAIWGFIEGIMILAGSINKDARGIPLA